MLVIFISKNKDFFLKIETNFASIKFIKINNHVSFLLSSDLLLSVPLLSNFKKIYDFIFS